MTLYCSARRIVVMNNQKFGRSDPPWEIRTSKDDPTPVTVHDATFTGTIRLVYNPHDKLISGSQCWIEIDEDGAPPPPPPPSPTPPPPPPAPSPDAPAPDAPAPDAPAPDSPAPPA